MVVTNTVLIFSLALAGLQAGQKPQGAETSARAVALRYAIKNGLTLPEGKRALVLEPDFLQRHATGPATSAEVRSSDAQKIRQVVTDARVDSGDQLLRCVNSDCVPSRNEAVILVRDLQVLNDRSTVLVSVYLPTDDPKQYDGRRAMAIVQVASTGTSFEAIKFTQPPQVFPVRLHSK